MHVYERRSCIFLICDFGHILIIWDTHTRERSVDPDFYGHHLRVIGIVGALPFSSNLSAHTGQPQLWEASNPLTRQGLDMVQAPTGCPDITADTAQPGSDTGPLDANLSACAAPDLPATSAVSALHRRLRVHINPSARADLDSTALTNSGMMNVHARMPSSPFTRSGLLQLRRRVSLKSAPGRPLPAPPLMRPWQYQPRCRVSVAPTHACRHPLPLARQPRHPALSPQRGSTGTLTRTRTPTPQRMVLVARAQHPPCPGPDHRADVDRHPAHAVRDHRAAPRRLCHAGARAPTTARRDAPALRTPVRAIAQHPSCTRLRASNGPLAHDSLR